MSIPNTSEKSIDLDRQENLTKGNVSVKKVAVYQYDAGSDTLTPGLDLNVNDIAQTDVFNQMIIGTRNNQLEVDFSGTDPDSISLLTVTKTNGGDASTAGGQAVFETGTDANGEIKAITTRTVTYHPHSENYAAFTAIFTQGIGNAFQRIGLYDDNNGFFIGYEGAEFGVTIRSGGTDTFTLQALFNQDKLLGQAGSKYTRNGTPEALDKSKDNLYRVRYGWLGAAPIYYEVLSPDGEWVTFHIIKHPNTVAVPTVQEPNQPLRIHIKKTNDGVVNLSVKTACWAAGTTSDLQKINATVYDETLVKPVRSILTAKKPNGSYTNIGATAGDNLKVSVEEIDPAAVMPTTSAAYKTLIDETTTPSVTYLGKAAIGTATSAASWQISKIDESGSVTSITWSGSGFTAIWDNRATTVVYT